MARKKSDRLEVKVTKCPIIRGKLSELIIVGDRKINNLRIARSCHEFVFCLHRRHDGADGRGRRRSGQKSEEERIQSDIVALQHESSISNPICGFSMMEQVRLCDVWPTENWLGSSMNHLLSGYATGML